MGCGEQDLGEDGTFRFEGVPSGQYRLFYLAGVEGVVGSGGLTVGFTDVAVRDGDVADIRIAVPESITVKGSLSVEAGHALSARGLRVVLAAVDRIMDASCAGEVDARGMFLWQGCSPGRYKLSISPLPAGWYVQEIRSGATSLVDDVLSLVAGADLNVVLRRGAGRIREQLASRRSGWYLVAPREKPAAFVLGARDNKGTFVVDNLRSGAYEVVGLDAPDVLALHNLGVVRALASLGVEAVLEEGAEAHITVSIASGARVKTAGP